MNRVRFAAAWFVVSAVIACSPARPGPSVEPSADAGTVGADNDSGMPTMDAGGNVEDDGGSNEDLDAGIDAGIPPDPHDDEYGECARGCPAERPYCTPAGSCSACDGGHCGNTPAVLRDQAGGNAPNAATAWPDELQVGGVFVNGLDLGTGPLQTTHMPQPGRFGRGDLYLATLTSGGATSSVETFLTSNWARVVELEHFGSSVLIRGQFGNDLDLRGDPLTESSFTHSAEFVALFDREGKVAWHQIFEAGTADLMDASFLDDGDVVIAGHLFKGKSLNFGGGSITSTNVNGDAFLARIGPKGEQRFSRLLAEGTTRPYAVAAAPDGGFVVAGTLGRDTDFGGGALSNDSSYATFVVRYDAAGQHVWSKRYPEPGQNLIAMNAAYLAVSHDGSIVFGAGCGGTLTFEGGGQMVVDGQFSACVISLDAQGGFRSGVSFPRASGATLWGLQLDPWGQPVLLADFKAPLELGGETFTPTSNTMLVMRTDPNTMAPNFTALVQGDAGVSPSALAVAADGEIFVTGWHDGAMDFPDGSRSETPGMFVMRWGP